MDRLLAELTEMVTDSSYIHPDPKILEELDEPILEYWVRDNMTYNELARKKNFSDNETYSTFQKISRKGKKTDFIKMTENKNPAIRVYGFWALLKNDNLGIAIEILEKEKQISENVFWDSFGCEVFPRKTEDLMEELMENHKKYGS